MKQRKHARANGAFIDHYNNVIYPRQPRSERAPNEFHERNCRSYEDYLPDYERAGYVYDDGEPYEDYGYYDVYKMSHEGERKQMDYDYRDPICPPLRDECYQRNLNNDNHFDINHRMNFENWAHMHRQPSYCNDHLVGKSQNFFVNSNDNPHVGNSEYIHRRPSRCNDDFIGISQNFMTQRKKKDSYPLRRSQSLESFNRIGRKSATRDMLDTLTRWTDSTISTKKSLRSLFRHKEVMDNVKKKNASYKSSIRPRKLFRDRSKTDPNITKSLSSKSLSTKEPLYDERVRTMYTPNLKYPKRIEKCESISDELYPSIQNEREIPKRNTWFENQTNKMKLAFWQAPSQLINRTCKSQTSDPNIPKIIETKQESIFSEEKEKEQRKLPDYCCFDDVEHNYLFAANACCLTVTLLVLFS